MSKQIYRLVLAGFSLAASNLLAESLADPQTLEPMIVTATRTTRTLDDTVTPVSVITRDDIVRRQAVSLPQILRGLPGLSVVNNGGLGKNTSVNLRGTESDHVLVLIDGQRVGSATVGTTAFQDLPIDQIERIEIVRGPRSSLYGSEAIGGVIQIFTRKGDKKLRPSFSVGGGSHDTYKIYGGLSGGVGAGWFNLSASHLDSEGFNACDGAPFPVGAGCFTLEPDDDGYRNTSGNVRGGVRFDSGLELEANFLHAEGRNEFDGSAFGGNQGDFLQQVLGGTLRYSPLSMWDLTLRAGRNLDESDIFFNGVFVDRFDTERVNVTLQNDIELNNHLLTAGLDFYHDNIDSSKDFAEDSRYNIAGFGQYQGSFRNHDLVLGIRYDENQQFGGKVTGNVGWGYTLANDLRLTANGGTAFKAPSFNELYFPNFGNENLGPEESWSIDAGVAGKHGGVDWSLSGYYTGIDELIIAVQDTNLCLPPFFFCAKNVSEARIVGLEASATTRFWGWDIAASFSYIDHENQNAGPNKGKRLPRRPKEMFQLNVDRKFGRYSVGTSVYAAGSRYDDLANQQRLGGYVTVDLRGGIELHKNLFLEGQVTNLLDKDYETARLFNQDGVNLFVTLRYQP